MIILGIVNGIPRVNPLKKTRVITIIYLVRWFIMVSNGEMTCRWLIDGKQMII